VRVAVCGDGGAQSAELSRVVMWDTGVKWPFTSTPDAPSKGWQGGEDGIAAPAEWCHARGAVHCLRYSADGLTLASMGTNGLVCFYDGVTMELRCRVVNAHGSSRVTKLGQYLGLIFEALALPRSGCS
jgi:hypothetical protein